MCKTCRKCTKISDAINSNAGNVPDSSDKTFVKLIAAYGGIKESAVNVDSLSVDYIIKSVKLTEQKNSNHYPSKMEKQYLKYRKILPVRYQAIWLPSYLK